MSMSMRSMRSIYFFIFSSLFLIITVKTSHSTFIKSSLQRGRGYTSSIQKNEYVKNGQHRGGCGMYVKWEQPPDEKFNCTPLTFLITFSSVFPINSISRESFTLQGLVCQWGLVMWQGLVGCPLSFSISSFSFSFFFFSSFHFVHLPRHGHHGHH